jgi:maltose alpha-D-glucosyltransferase/alpha-amylase
MDPVYGYAAVNVEAQQRNPSSFLHWMRRILAVRREFPVFGTGQLQVVPSANPSVLAFVRSSPDLPARGPVNPVLCVHNLSKLAQPAEIHVERWVGRQPIELLGRVAFPLIGTEPYRVTLAPYGSQCFELA